MKNMKVKRLKNYWRKANKTDTFSNAFKLNENEREILKVWERKRERERQILHHSKLSNKVELKI